MMSEEAPNKPPSNVTSTGNERMSLDYERIRRCQKCNAYLCTVDIYSSFVMEGHAIVRDIKCWKCGIKNDVKLFVNRPRS